MTTSIGHREIEQLRAVVAERLGLSFDESRLGVLADVLRRRIEASGSSAEAYLSELAGHASPEELRRLAQELTVTETYFYRNPDQIRAFIEIALPHRLEARADGAAVRILSAGCASGEEPFSLAMAIRDERLDAAGRVSITGADVNPAMLDKARRASFSAWSLRELPQRFRSRWFRSDSGAFELHGELRCTVKFEERNLSRDDPDLWQPRTWDVVFCRNVLMYFHPELARALVARIARSLVPGGYLFLGHAETLRGLSHDFHLCHTHGTFYYRRKDPDGIASEHEVTYSEWRPTAAPAALCLTDTSSWVDTVRQAADRIRTLAEVSQELSSPPSASRRIDLHPALDLLRREHYEAALAQLDALPAEQTQTPEVLLLRAISAAHGGALDQAETLCRALLAREEMNAGAHYVLALCREGRGDTAGALEEDRVAVYLDPGFAMARLHQGLLARRKGERASARRELAQALTSLQHEDPSRLLLFGGGFSREALTALCRAELNACGGI